MTSSKFCSMIGFISLSLMIAGSHPIMAWQPSVTPTASSADKTTRKQAQSRMQQRTVVQSNPLVSTLTARQHATALHIFAKDNKATGAAADDNAAEETTKQFGLEAGLMKAAKDNDGESAKSLLKKYGIAYLATSIPLALVSFAVCYFLVDSGVDVASLLSGIGIESSSMADKAGTFAIAYAAHKALSPVRFPPTVILTPVVAKLIGKEPEPVTEE
eukprot:CAMPEP_0198116522 /NCGR_PEP_ID=MMETSP1442-20131203/13088_1 /TAXON_ID= /ORGANISM="Craspedostauros australis, Strain CCMP3328" /LENGTH=215 /DNA_ID=CAMNT_0043774371 /DNA_START=162 /DNA_END=809 /DNA_ORIENTATION=-